MTISEIVIRALDWGGIGVGSVVRLSVERKDTLTGFAALYGWK